MRHSVKGDRNEILVTRRDFVNGLIVSGSMAVTAPLLLHAASPDLPSRMTFDSGRRRRSMDAHVGRYEVAGKALHYSDRMFSLTVNDKKLSVSDFRLASALEGTQGTVSLKRFIYTNDVLQAQVVLEWPAARPEIRKWLEVTNSSGQPVRITEVDIEVFQFEPGAIVEARESKAGVEPVLIRNGNCALLLLLDFACSRVNRDGEVTEFGYRPYVTLASGDTYRSHAALSCPFDPKNEPTNVVRRVASSRFPFPHDRPLHLYIPLSQIWMYLPPHNLPPDWEKLEAHYSPYQGNGRHPLIHYDLEWMKQEFRLARDLGCNYVQPYGYIDYMLPQRGSPEVIHEIVRYGHPLGLKVVGSMGVNALYFGFFGVLGENDVAVEQPHLWWTWDQGPQNLYIADVSLVDGQGRVLAWDSGFNIKNRRHYFGCGARAHPPAARLEGNTARWASGHRYGEGRPSRYRHKSRRGPAGRSRLRSDDLGADVPPERFVDVVKANAIDIVCLAALLTVTMPSMKATIDVMKEAGVRNRVKVLIGGAPVTAQYAEQIGADAFGENASTAMKAAPQLVQTRS